MKKITRLLAALVALLLVLSGCASSGGGASDGEKDSLVFSINADITTVDAAKSKDLVTNIVKIQMYDTLIRKTPEGNLEPGLAEDWEISDDAMHVDFTIRQGVKFHNGDTMTAEDVAFSLNRAIESSFTASLTNAMQDAEVLDDTHVRLNLKMPFGPVLQCLTDGCMGIVSKRAVEEMGEEFEKNPVGTGPYQFVEWKSGERIELKAFEDYWRGSPSIKNLTFLVMTNKNTAAIALENGEIDVLYAPSSSDREHLMSLPNVQYLETEVASYYYVLAFNTESEIFSNQKLREAISYAINREDIVLGALDGMGAPVEMPIAPNAFGYDPDFQGHPYDVDKAKELMAEAGYPDGLTVTIKLNQSSVYTRPAEIVQAQLREIGINLEFELMERSAYLTDVTTDCNYDITLYMFSNAYDDADYVFYGRLYSENIGSTNYTRYSNPEVDEMIMQARTSSDEEERMQLYEQISQVVIDDVPFIPLATGASNIAANSQLSGVQPSPNELHYVFDYAWNTDQAS